LSEKPVPPSPPSPPSPSDTRCGFVAVLGAPNAGKSTLINAMVGTKVTIVSDKVQTTRTLVRGIVMHDRTQIVFIDTPGIFSPQKRLERAMVSAAWSGTEDADIVMVVVDLDKKNIPGRETENIINRLKDLDVPAVLILNKIDTVRPEKLLTIAQDMNTRHDFAATFMVSATRKSGTKDIVNWLSTRLPDNPWIFPEDDVSDMPMRLLAAEITREKLFHKLYRELPYALTVETESWENFDDGSIRIEQVIYVEREGQRKIILGKDGDMIRHVGEKSRLELAELFETPVHLKLFIKVRENWSEDSERYEPWGLDFNA
jgi:GTP-binding protein Era